MQDPVNLNLLKSNLNKNDELNVKAHPKRWIILFVFVYYSAMNAFQWIEYPIINNIVIKYYNVSAATVDWTSIIYMALYAPLVVPASYIIDKKGLRVAGLIGGLGTAFGTAIKVFSIGRNSFWIVLLGQSITGASQTVILCLPPRLAAVWFKPNEVSTACSLGVMGNLLGCAIGFLLPPIIVQNHDNPEDIGSDLKILCWGLTIIMLPVTLILIIWFPAQPANPPSITQAEERRFQQKYTWKAFILSFKVLFKNPPFMAHVVAYGITIAVFSAISTLLNQYILSYFPNSEEDAGRMGLLMVVVGLISSVLFGIYLDRSHKYKESTVGINLWSSISVVIFMFALEFKSKVLVYIAIAIFGLFTNAYMPVGFEFAMELTFPSPESTTAGILMAPSQIMGVICTIVLSKLNIMLGPFWALSTQALLLLIGTIITCFIPNLHKRQDAFKNGQREHELAKLQIKSQTAIEKIFE